VDLVKAIFRERLGHNLGCSVLFKLQLWVGMNVAPNRSDRANNAADCLRNFHGFDFIDK
jgi:hypothetical protein